MHYLEDVLACEVMLSVADGSVVKQHLFQMVIPAVPCDNRENPYRLIN